MKKKFYLGSVTLATLLFFSSCSNCTGDNQQTKTVKKDSVMLPKTATDGQVYRDNNGNQWMFNAMMGYWMMSSLNRDSGRENHYYYYPSTGTYQDNTGRIITPPASVTSGVTTTKTVTVPATSSSKSVSSSSSSSSSSKVKSKATTPSSKKSVFGSTGRSHSIGA